MKSVFSSYIRRCKAFTLASIIFAVEKRSISRRLSLIIGPFKAPASGHRCAVTLHSSLIGHVIIKPAVLTSGWDHCRQRCTSSAGRKRMWKTAVEELGEKIQAHVTINNNKRHLLIQRRVAKGFWGGREIPFILSNINWSCDFGKIVRLPCAPGS